MSPKRTFNKQDILEAAFAVVQKQGINSLTARNVAKAMRSSTAPVYHHYRSMDELKRDVFVKTKDLLFEYMLKPVTGRIAIDMGVGYIQFGHEQCELFRFLFLGRDIFNDLLDELLKEMSDHVRTDYQFKKFNDDELYVLLRKNWIFTHGLATLRCVGLLKENEEQFINDLIPEIELQIKQALQGKS